MVLVSIIVGLDVAHLLLGVGRRKIGHIWTPPCGQGRLFQLVCDKETVYGHISGLWLERSFGSGPG